MEGVKLFFLFLFCFSSIVLAVSPCGLVFQHVFPERAKNDELALSLGAVGVDAVKAKAFLAKWGTEVRTWPAGTVDGLPSKFILPHSPSDNSGHRNAGIYFFKRGDSPRVLKTFDAQMDNPRTALMSFIRALEGASLGEQLGAPKIFQFGRTSDGKYYIEMEQAFPNESSSTVKEWFSGWNKPGHGLETFEASVERTEKVFRKMAELEIEALSRNVSPSDPDYLVNDAGEVRWIDSHNWVRSDWRTPAMNNPRRGSYGAQRATFLQRFAATKPAAAKQYVEVFLEELKHSPLLSATDKEILLEELFFSHHHVRYSRDGSARAALVSTGLMKENDYRDPYEIVLELYSRVK